MSGLLVVNRPELLHQWLKIQDGAEQIDQLIKDLPHINEKQLADLGEKDSSCPICFTPYLALIAEEEIAFAMDSPAHPVDTAGITRLSQPWQCGHMFCRRDISKWITDGHDSCPLCRHSLAETDRGRQDNEDSGEQPPNTDGNAIRADTEELTTQLGRQDDEGSGEQSQNTDGIAIEELWSQLSNLEGAIPLDLTFHGPDVVLQENTNGGIEYSHMYS